MFFNAHFLHISHQIETAWACVRRRL